MAVLVVGKEFAINSYKARFIVNLIALIILVAFLGLLLPNIYAPIPQ